MVDQSGCLGGMLWDVRSMEMRSVGLWRDAYLHISSEAVEHSVTRIREYSVGAAVRLVESLPWSWVGDTRREVMDLLEQFWNNKPTFADIESALTRAGLGWQPSP